MLRRGLVILLLHNISYGDYQVIISTLLLRCSPRHVKCMTDFQSGNVNAPYPTMLTSIGMGGFPGCRKALPGLQLLVLRKCVKVSLKYYFLCYDNTLSRVSGFEDVCVLQFQLLIITREKKIDWSI